MSANPQESQTVEAKSNDKELNFRKQEEMFKRQLEQERQARLQAEERAAKYEKERQQKAVNTEDDDDISDEPYVDHKALTKKLSKLEKTFEEKINKTAEEKARALIEQRDKDTYLRERNDFNEVMSPENLQKFCEKHPAVAESLMRMPDSFERQKLVYESLKALKVGQKEEAKSGIQDKIDQNRRSPYYQPSGTAGPGYQSQGDFSPAGQKNAYEKLKQLKANLRI